MKGQLDSVSIPAHNPTRLRDFYVALFDLEEDIARSHPPGFYLLKGGKGCNLLIMDAEGSNTETGTKGFELGMQVDNMEQLEKQVTEAGGAVQQVVQQMDWGQSMIITDPEGHNINAYKFRQRQ